MTSWFDQRRRTRYNNVETKYAGLSFASKGEAECHAMLQLMEKGNELTIEKVQDHVYLTEARILYIADFKIKLANGDAAWVEFKGFETDVWRIKRRLWMHYGPGKLFVYRKDKGRIFLHETLEPA